MAQLQTREWLKSAFVLAGELSVEMTIGHGMMPQLSVDSLVIHMDMVRYL